MTLAPPRTGFYLDRVVEQDEHRLVAERQLDGREAYLQHHLVDGTPTMPGCFALEMAAEAATALVPGSVVTRFLDLRLHQFLRLRGSMERRPLRITAVLRDRDVDQAVVDVRIGADVISPSGRLLVPDRLHFSVSVVLSDTYPAAPSWEPWPSADGVPLDDPYTLPGAPVALSGPFISTRDARLHPLGSVASYTRPAEGTSVFEDFLVPVLLLDGLLRLMGLELVNDRYIPVAAPLSIRRVDLYAAVNDATLSSRREDIALHATPRGLPGGHGVDPAGTRRGVASLPDGRVLLQLKDVTAAGAGFFDVRTGRHLGPAALDGEGPLCITTRAGVLPL
jgi:hypothetical protein